jgi:hypothetical protein
MSKSTRTLRTELPTEVWDRLAAEAAAAGVPLGRYARELFVKRDTKKHPVLSTSTGPTDKREDQS